MLLGPVTVIPALVQMLIGSIAFGFPLLTNFSLLQSTSNLLLKGSRGCLHASVSPHPSASLSTAEPAAQKLCKPLELGDENQDLPVPILPSQWEIPNNEAQHLVSMEI